MARPPAPQTWTTRPRRSRQLRCIVIVLLASIVLVGLAVLITWLVVRPKRLTYTIENGSIHGFDLTDNQLNATFDIILRAHNPNHRVSVYYDSMEVAVSYHEQTLAFDVVQPFLQPHRNFTRIGAKPVARSVSLLGSVAKELRNDKGSGELKLDVRAKAKIRFKMGLCKTLALAEDLTPNGEKEVFFELNGQLRSVFIRDKEASKEMHIHPKASKSDKNQVGAPMPGSVMEVRVKPGDKVEKGAPLVVLSAMKMEMVVQAPKAGVVKSVDVSVGMKLEGDDLLLSIE